MLKVFLALTLLATTALANDLQKAVEDRDVKAVKRLLSRGTDVNATNSSGQTALHIAAENDDAEIIALLLKAGADINAKDERGRTPLVTAVKNGYEGVKATAPLIAAHADLTGALYEAVNSDAPVPVQALIKAGAQIDPPSVYLAASMGRKVLPLLLRAGADVNAKNEDGATPLIGATETGEFGAARLLVEAKANVNPADKQGNTALIHAAGIPRTRMESFKVSEEDVTKIVEVLLAAGANVKAKTQSESVTPLIAAAREGHAGAVALLLEAKAPIDAKTTPDGYSALMEASKGGYEDVVATLIAAGADPKIKDRAGRTAASWKANAPAKPKEVSPENKEAAEAKLKELGYRYFDADNFVMAAVKGEVEAVQAFLDYGLPVDSTDSDDHTTTPLLAAARLDDPALGLFLIKAGANVNAKDTNGSTPIVLAAQQCGQAPLIKALIKAGADVNAKSAGGATALMLADMMKCTDSVKALKAAGAKK